MRVLEHDVQRQRLALRLGGNGGRYSEGHRFARLQLAVGIKHHRPIDEQVAVLDQAFQARPRQDQILIPGDLRGGDVKTPSGLLYAHREGEHLKCDIRLVGTKV